LQSITIATKYNIKNIKKKVLITTKILDISNNNKDK